MAQTDPILEVRDLTKTFARRPGAFEKGLRVLGRETGDQTAVAVD